MPAQFSRSGTIYVEQKVRLYVLAALLAASGYALGAGEPLFALGGLVMFVVFLPGLFGDPPLPAIETEPAPETVEAPSTDVRVGLEAIEDAAMIVSDAGTVLAANAAAVELFGETPGEDIRLALRQPRALETIEQALRTQAEAVQEIEGLGRQGAVFRLRCSPIGGGDILVNFVDVSSAKAAERMRADFVANASHELRTPLATLTGFIETLQGPAADDDAARDRFLGLMAGEAARMTRLIDDLLSLSRIELDKNLRPRTRTDLAEVIGEFAERSAPLAEATDHNLVIDMDEGLPSVLADRDQLFQVLTNLVSNAYKYSKPSTPVHLGVRQVEGGCLITVRDEGEGIEAEHIPRLTERFYRVDAGRSRSLGGTGLGLAIVKHIVERHRGRLEIRSEVGSGTTVSFSLPEAPADED